MCRITFGPNEISLPSQERLFVTYMYTCMYVRMCTVCMYSKFARAIRLVSMYVLKF